MPHIFFFPASYAAFLYALISATGLLSCLFIGVLLHHKEILTTSCGDEHYEFWPSISSTIGDMMPERQTWRVAFILCTPFRLGATISLFNVFWQKGSGGMVELFSFRSSWRQFISSNAFLALFLLWVDLWRLIGAVIWTMVASTESLGYHNVGFCPFVLLCFLLQLTATTLSKRHRYNLAIYPTQRDAFLSYRLKRFCLIGETVASLGVVCCFAYHFSTCANGSFSMSNIFEWSFALFNIVFDATSWYDLKKEGWWLSYSPSFYRKRWSHMKLQPSERSSDGCAANGGRAFERGTAPNDSLVACAKEETEGITTVDIAQEDEGRAVQQSGGEASASQASLPHCPTSGEYFLDRDVILHRFTFCCPPSQLVMWISDIYWAHLFIEMNVHLIQHMYFMPLIAMSLSWEISSVLFAVTPCLLRIRRFRRWATGSCPLARTLLKPSHVPVGLSHRVVPMYVFFYAVASLSHLQMLIVKSPEKKMFGIAVGLFFLSLAIWTRMLYPSSVTLRSAWMDYSEDSRRTIFAFPIGFVLCMLLRIGHLSVSPFFTEPFYAGVFGIVFGLASTTFIYRHAMFGNALKEGYNETPGGSAGGPKVSSTENEDARSARVSANGNIFSVQRSAIQQTNLQGGAQEDSREGRKELDSYSPRSVHFKMGQSDEVTENTVSMLAVSYTAPSSILLGILFGTTISFGVTFFNCANYIPRLVAINPFPANLAVVACFFLGVFYATDILPVSTILHRPKIRVGLDRRFLHVIFRGSWLRFGAALAAGTLVLLYGTRQTNFSYELSDKKFSSTPTMGIENVKIENWGVQENFSGSPLLAFTGGLVLSFCFGALLPFIMEVCIAHQRDRRFASMAEGLDLEAAFAREGNFFRSFELWTGFSMFAPCIAYALCISYPFVPMAEILREKSRPVIMIHLAVIYFTAWSVSRRIRSSKVASGAITDVALGRKQRSVQVMITLLTLLTFFCVIIGYITMANANVGFPSGKKTANLHMSEVFHLHRMLLELRKERNRGTDSQLKSFERTFYNDRYNDLMSHMERNITNSKEGQPVDPKYMVGHLSQEDRVDVLNAAKALTSFSGTIWTVHFALDNYNVDSLKRMAMQLAKTEASVIGLLESDTMHLTNGNRDMVEYIAYYLGFPYTDYGPTALDNTYGCALITRYPILNVKRYVMPSPLGELACVIHATLDIYGLPIQVYVGHFGNTVHWVDGMLQSLFLKQLVMSNPGPAMWLGYLVTHPGLEGRYQEYTHPLELGKFRDTALDLYANRTWVRLMERGGYVERVFPSSTPPPDSNLNFNVDYKIRIAKYLEEKISIDDQFHRVPKGEAPRHFYFNETGRYTNDHPRFEFLDRYCQYILYKTGAAKDELPQNENRLLPYQIRLFDWWRIVSGAVEELSDTEIQVVQFEFEARK